MMPRIVPRVALVLCLAAACIALPVDDAEAKTDVAKVAPVAQEQPAADHVHTYDHDHMHMEADKLVAPEPSKLAALLMPGEAEARAKRSPTFKKYGGGGGYGGGGYGGGGYGGYPQGGGGCCNQCGQCGGGGGGYHGGGGGGSYSQSSSQASSQSSSYGGGYGKK